MPDLRTPPLISVVLPCHNSGRWLAITLDSVRHQTEQSWEAIVVDDGSTDETLAVARRYAELDPRIVVVEQANGGAASARNAGFRASNPASRYVTFMDSDDVWLPTALATLRSRLANSPEVIGAHGLAETVDATGTLYEPGAYPAFGRNRVGLQGRRLVVWPVDRPTEFDILINGNVLFPPGLLLARRSAYERAGPFDTAFNGPEDWDMLIRLSRQGPIAFVDEVILHYRRHDANLGAGPRVEREAWLVRCKGFHSSENTPAQSRAARRGWRAYQAERAAAAGRALLAELRARQLRPAVTELARIAVLVVRWIRGYPRPHYRSELLEW